MAKRNAPGEGQLVETKDGLVARVTLPRAGPGRAKTRQKAVPKHLTRLSDQRAFLRDFKARVYAELAAAAQAPPPPPETVGEYLARWLDELPADLAWNTLRSRRNAVTRHLIPALGRHPLGELTPRQVEAALRSLPLAASSAVGVRSILVIALNDAVRLELIPRNPATLARAPKRIKAKRPRLTVEQARRLIAVADGERLGRALLLAVCLGLRRGEMQGLRWSDIDWQRGTLAVEVQRSFQTGAGLVERAPKNNSGRVIQMPDVVADALQAQRDAQRWERQQHGYRDHDLVFCRVDGRPLASGALASMFARVFARHDADAAPEGRIGPIRPHDLRGSSASILLSLGVPLPTVMQILGHRKASTTLESYADSLPADREKAAELLNTALGGR